MKLYSGIKELKHEIEPNKILVDEKAGFRYVRVNQYLLKSVLINPENEKMQYQVFDWGKTESEDFTSSHIRDRGMNLAASIIHDYLGELKDGEVIPNELVFRFYRDVICNLKNSWQIREEQIKSYLARVYSEMEEKV